MSFLFQGFLRTWVPPRDVPFDFLGRLYSLRRRRFSGIPSEGVPLEIAPGDVPWEVYSRVLRQIFQNFHPKNHPWFIQESYQQLVQKLLKNRFREIYQMCQLNFVKKFFSVLILQPSLIFLLVFLSKLQVLRSIFPLKLSLELLKEEVQEFFQNCLQDFLCELF